MVWADESGGNSYEMELARPVPTVKQVDSSLPVFVPDSEKIEGELFVECSLLVEPIVRRWATEFGSIYPNAKITAVPVDKNFDVARITTRPETHVVLFEGSGSLTVALDGRRGEFSWPVIVGIDRVEIVVHPNNRIKELSVNEFAWIFSEQGASSPALKSEEKVFLEHPRIDDWKELGRTNLPSFAQAPISVYRRQPFTDEDGFIKQQGSGGFWGDGFFGVRDRRADARVVETPDDMIRAVNKDRYGMGYISHSLLSSKVRSVPVKGMPPSVRASAERGSVPYLLNLPSLARPIYLWVTPSGEAARPKLESEFIRFALSLQGQRAMSKEGFFPLPSPIAKIQLGAALRISAPQ